MPNPLLGARDRNEQVRVGFNVGRLNANANQSHKILSKKTLFIIGIL